MRSVFDAVSNTFGIEPPMPSDDNRRFGGFRLVLKLDRRQLLDIRISGDRLAIDKARTSAPIAVSAVPR
jgi:hypothetical protein